MGEASYDVCDECGLHGHVVGSDGIWFADEDMCQDIAMKSLWMAAEEGFIETGREVVSIKDKIERSGIAEKDTDVSAETRRKVAQWNRAQYRRPQRLDPRLFHRLVL